MYETNQISSTFGFISTFYDFSLLKIALSVLKQNLNLSGANSCELKKKLKSSNVFSFLSYIISFEK